MDDVDLAFVGNGIIAVVSALEIKAAHPERSVALIGPFSRPYSASIAAGAMHAAFCEVEETFHRLPRDQMIFHAALEARSLWHAFLERFKLKDVVTADDTIMYRRKNGTLFEEANFEAACDIARQHDCLQDVPASTLEAVFQGNIRPSDVIARTFVGEFSLDAGDFFQRIQNVLLATGVMLLDDSVTSITPSTGRTDIELLRNGTLHAARVVLAAGTPSQGLLPDEFPVIPIHHAVGTSMTLDSAPASYSSLKMVVRTPNRGGAQCGMHIVPRNHGKFFLGAGNYLSDKTPAHRVETIRYLIDTCDVELFGKQVIYNARAELLLGSRPKSVDGYPVIGSYTRYPDIFIATGTYRIGLTIAPMIAAEISRWHDGLEPTSAFKDCSPERALHSYASMNVATRYFSESRISNLIEHGILDMHDHKAIADKKLELEHVARNHNAAIVRKHGFAPEFVADPDMYTMLLGTEA